LPTVESVCILDFMPIQDLEGYFTSGARSAGYRFFADGKVSVTQHSDSEITAYVKPSFKVTLNSASIEDSRILATCNCPDFKKGRLCKHAWAAVLGAEDKSTDFMENKTEIEIRTDDESTTKPSYTKRPETQSQIAAKAAYKAKQKEYSKQQYQKQKQRLKDIKTAKKKAPEVELTFPKPIEKAFSYFLQNGFDLKISFNEESISRARKKLSRVFHPDISGTHEEILELNKNTELLLKFVATKG
jgi:hypothetical protein